MFSCLRDVQELGLDSELYSVFLFTKIFQYEIWVYKNICNNKPGGEWGGAGGWRGNKMKGRKGHELRNFMYINISRPV